MDRAKSTIVPILLIVVFGLAFAAGIRSLTSNKGAGHGGDLQMASDTAAAFAAAKKDDKVVMVKYGADWCPPCKEMKIEAFSDDGVAEVLKDVIVVDVDVDDPGPNGEWVKDNWSGGSIPTVRFYRADGNMIGEIVGYGGVRKFKQEARKILDKA